MITKMYMGRKAQLVLYDRCKYDENSQEAASIPYFVENFDIATGVEAYEIAKQFEESGADIDPYNEYLVLHLKGGDTATFRNSYCDLFGM